MASFDEQAVTLLQDVQKLLSDKTCWTKGALAKGKKGFTGHPSDDTAISWCVLGALYRCSRLYDMKAKEIAEDRLLEACRKLFKANSVVKVNDGHGYEAIMSCLKEAIHTESEVSC